MLKRVVGFFIGVHVHNGGVVVTTDEERESDREPAAGREYPDLDPASITQLLNSVDDGLDGLNQVFGAVYAELKPIARNILAMSQHATLTPTVVLHEAYAKLIGSENLNLQGRRHFFALCARTMRQIVVDYARSRMSAKRSPDQPLASLNDVGVIDFEHPESLVAMGEALQWLEERDPRLVELIHLRIYAGLSLDEIAPLMEVTTRQLQRDWQRGRVWMTEALLQPVV